MGVVREGRKVIVVIEIGGMRIRILVLVRGVDGCECLFGSKQ